METQETSGLFDGGDIRRLLSRATALWHLDLDVGGNDSEPPAGTAEVRLHVGRRVRGWLAARAADGGAAPDRALVEFLGDVVASLADKERELAALSSDLVDRYEEVTLLYDLARDLASVFDEDAICAAGGRLAATALSAGRVCVALAGDGGALRVAAAPEWPEPPSVGEESLAAAVIERGKPLLLHPEEPWEGRAADRPSGEAALAVALQAPGDAVPLGAMVLAGGPVRRFSSADSALASTIAEQMASAVRSARQVSALREAERVARELEIAAEIQRSLLPDEAPAVAGVALAGECLPAANVGGDYYDFVVDPTGVLHLVVADVSGHSVGSALLMAVGRSILRREMGAGSEPAEVIRRTSAALYDDLVGAGLFITIFCARYDPIGRRLSFASGGHNPPLLYRPADGSFTLLDADGTPAGFLDDFDYVQAEVDLAAGDVVVLYTDGVVEAGAPDGDQFGLDRFEEVIRAAHDAGAAGLLVAVERAVEGHLGGRPRADDLTVAVLEVR